MLSFIVFLIIGFIVSSFMYSYFAHHAVPEPMEQQEAEVVIIGKKSNSTAKAA